MKKLFSFTNVIGTFIFNEHMEIIDSILFSNKEGYINKEKTESVIIRKFGKIPVLNEEKVSMALEIFKDKAYFEKLYKINLELTKDKLRNSMTDDHLILQAISTIDELDKVINLLAKRIREWYSYYNPEASESIDDNKRFIELIKSGKIRRNENSFGSNLAQEDIQQIVRLAEKVNDLSLLRKDEEDYLERMMKKLSPNMTALAGNTIGAKILQKAGSLKNLIMLPASTIQLLGAEKALFRHLKNKKNLSPKFGFLHDHPFVMKVKKEHRGKVARILADKVAIAAKVDYFKGKFIGDKLRTEIEEKIMKWC